MRGLSVFKMPDGSRHLICPCLIKQLEQLERQKRRAKKIKKNAEKTATH